MKYSASLENRPGVHQVTLKVGDKEQSLPIPPRETGGSSLTGGELLFLALATCYCNDIYREATARGIKVTGVEVKVEGDFEAPRLPGTNIVYRARVTAEASDEQIRELMLHTDTIAEVHNTLRVGTPVKLEI
ncbi:MAG TPA: OsmC family protein [Anaerolineales bacterium]|nr:OsmC family protein [Anaerolineales bacterium]